MIDLDPIDTDTDTFAALYDELPLWSAPFGLWLLDRAPMRTGMTILDIGAGTGFLSIELAQRCGPTTRVIAVDPWGAAMRRLQRKVEQRGLGNVQLLLQDAADLTLPDASIDLIVSNLGINNFAEPDAVLERCARAARPSAALLMTTNLVGHMAEFYEVYRQVLFETGQADRIPALEAHIRHRATVESVGARLGDAGFAVEEVVRDAFRWRFADGSALLGHFFIRLGFLDGWKTIASATRIAETFDRLEQALNERASRHGELSLTIPTAGFVARKRHS